MAGGRRASASPSTRCESASGFENDSRCRANFTLDHARASESRPMRIRLQIPDIMARCVAKVARRCRSCEGGCRTIGLYQTASSALGDLAARPWR